MKRRRLLVMVIAPAALALGLGFAATRACSRHHGSVGEKAVDTEIMAFLSEARALHHQANLAEEGGELENAIGAIDRLVAARRPHPERTTPEVEEVLADAYARLAELKLKKGELDPARAAVGRGLGHAEGATYFRGHLIEVQGLVEEARAEQLKDAGRPEEAKRAREHAVELLEEVVRIQDQVIQRSLAGDGGTGAGK